MREWDLLQTAVVPPLLELNYRTTRTWSVGCVEDAVAVAVAYGHARGSDDTSDAMQLYVAVARNTPNEVGFDRADLRCVPLESQTAYFSRQDRRWMADDVITERILLGDPSEPVDLITVRTEPAGPEGRLDAIFERLAPGGQLLLIGTADTPESISERLEPVAASDAGTVYRKSQPLRCVRPRTQRECRAEPLDATDPGESAAPLETVAHRRTSAELVQTHLRLARSLARRFAHHGETTDDLEQVAMLALVKAARRFDPARDIRFSTFATSSVLGELKRHFRDKSWMLRVPRSVQETYLSVKRARDELTHLLQATPSVSQIASHLGTTEKAVLDAMRAGDNFWPASLDDATGGKPKPDVPWEDDSFDQSLQRIQVQQLLPELDEREKLVLKRLYFDDCTQRELSTELGVSQMQVSRLRAAALSKLRS